MGDGRITDHAKRNAALFEADPEGLNRPAWQWLYNCVVLDRDNRNSATTLRVAMTLALRILDSPAYDCRSVMTSTARLAEHLNVDRRSVRRAIANLKAAGLIAIERRGEAGTLVRLLRR